MKKAEPIKPLDGQKSLLPDVPTVRKCRRCKRLLTGARSVKRRMGPTCAKHAAEECDGGGLKDDRLEVGRAGDAGAAGAALEVSRSPAGEGVPPRRRFVAVRIVWSDLELVSRSGEWQPQ